VLETFVGPRPYNMECRHLDGNKLNNNLDNVCWGTHTENSKDSIDHLTHTALQRQAKDTILRIIYLHDYLKFTKKNIGLMFNLSRRQISNIVNKKCFKYIWT